MKNKGTTLIELMMTVTVVGTVMLTSLVGYHKLLELQREKEAVLDLTAIAAAQEIYHAKHRHYWPEDGDLERDISQINEELNINLLESAYFEYTCIKHQSTMPDPPQNFYCKATYKQGNGWHIVIQKNRNGGQPYCLPVGGKWCPTCKMDSQGGC